MTPEEQELDERRVGHIRLSAVLGEGGMGKVFVGFDEALQRRVAVKVIRNEFRLQPKVKARFLREARILSQLDHPSVCRVHDYVEGEEQDFLVLEFVEGSTLRAALLRGLAESQKLAIARQLLDVLVAVHGRGIMHRDLKPENIMVTGDGIKVLDFGLARSADGEARRLALAAARHEDEGDGIQPATRSERARRVEDLEDGATIVHEETPHSLKLRTRRGVVLGTIGYMSPEQARGEAATTASDMYAVGLILQEMFTGCSPLPTDLETAELLQWAARGETIPVKGVDPQLTILINRLKSPAPGARPSAQDAAELLQRVIDRPRRRRRRLVLAAVWLALLTLTAAMTVQSIRAGREKARAEQEADTAEQALEFLVELFDVSDPREARGRTVTAREVLDRGAEKIEDELADQPVVRARLFRAIGRVYRELGLFVEAQDLLERAVGLHERFSGPESDELASSLYHLGVVHVMRGESERSAELLQRSLDIYERLQAPDAAQLGRNLNAMANLERRRGRFDEAERLYLKASACWESALAEDDLLVALGLGNLGALYLDLGRHDEAEPLLERAVEIAEASGGEAHPSLALHLSSLGNLRNRLGRSGEAVKVHRRALSIRQKALGERHPRVAESLNNIAVAAMDAGDFVEAEALFGSALEIWREAYGENHPRVAVALQNLGTVARWQEDLEAADRYYRESLQLREDDLGPDNPLVAESQVYLASNLTAQGLFAEAEALFHRALTIWENAGVPQHRMLEFAIDSLVWVLRQEDRSDEATALLARWFEIRRRSSGRVDALALVSAEKLIDLEVAIGREELALAFWTDLERSLRGEPDATPAESERSSRCARLYLKAGRIQHGLGRQDEAHTSWRKAVEIATPLAGDGADPQVLDTLARSLLMLGEVESARPYAEELLGRDWQGRDLLDLCREHGMTDREAAGR